MDNLVQGGHFFTFFKRRTLFDLNMASAAKSGGGDSVEIIKKKSAKQAVVATTTKDVVRTVRIQPRQPWVQGIKRDGDYRMGIPYSVKNDIPGKAQPKGLWINPQPNPAMDKMREEKGDAAIIRSRNSTTIQPGWNMRPPANTIAVFELIQAHKEKGLQVLDVRFDPIDDNDDIFNLNIVVQVALGFEWAVLIETGNVFGYLSFVPCVKIRMVRQDAPLQEDEAEEDAAIVAKAAAQAVVTRNAWGDEPEEEAAVVVVANDPAVVTVVQGSVAAAAVPIQQQQQQQQRPLIVVQATNGDDVMPDGHFCRRPIVGIPTYQQQQQQQQQQMQQPPLSPYYGPYDGSDGVIWQPQPPPLQPVYGNYYPVHYQQQQQMQQPPPQQLPHGYHHGPSPRARFGGGRGGRGGH